MDKLIFSDVNENVIKYIKENIDSIETDMNQILRKQIKTKTKKDGLCVQDGKGQYKLSIS